MMYQKKTYFFFLSIALLISVHSTSICMSPNNELVKTKLQAEIDLLNKQNATEELKRTHKDTLHAAKLNTQQKQAEKLQSDINQQSIENRTINGLIHAGSEGLSNGISNTIQHGGKKIIDRWLDGSSTTAETLIELDKREEILTRHIQNTKEAAAAQRPYLKTPAEIEALNAETRLEFQKIKQALKRNREFYEQVVAGRDKQQSTTESNTIASELPAENKPTEDPKLENNHQATDEIKVKTGLFAAASASCVTAAIKAGEYADLLAGYSFAHITKLDYFKDTFVSKHSVNINRVLVATTFMTTIYAAYRLYKSATHVENDDDIFNDDMYEF